MKKTIYALGYFDGVHLGHRALLSACREAAEEHGCKSGAVTFLGHPERLLTGIAIPLINTNEDREEMLLSAVDTVVELTFTESLMAMPWQDFIEMLLRDHGAAGFVCGSDFRFGWKGAGTAQLLADFCKEQGCSCTVVPEQTVKGIRVSSTHIRTLLEEGKMEEAAQFLGHRHILSGTVTRGRQLGRTIGVPTANLNYPEELVQLKKGVYACTVQADGKQYMAVTNVGTRPTVGGSHITAESFLLDFSGDLYGKQITVEFYEFLRPEQKFSSLEELKDQIQNDRKTVKKHLKKA